MSLEEKVEGVWVSYFHAKDSNGNDFDIIDHLNTLREQGKIEEVEKIENKILNSLEFQDYNDASTNITNIYF